MHHGDINENRPPVEITGCLYAGLVIRSARRCCCFYWLVLPDGEGVEGDVELVPPDEPELGEVLVVELEPDGVVESELEGLLVLEPVLDPLLSDMPVPDVPDVELPVPDGISLLEVPGEELPEVELSVPVVP